MPLKTLSLALLGAVALTVPAMAQEAAREHWGRGHGAEHVQRMCVEHYARTVGRLAYLEAKLNLSTEQAPLWDTWRASLTGGAQKEREACLQGAALGGGTPPTVVQRRAYFQRLLAAKADALQTSQPALEALYQALGPEQRALLDHPRPYRMGMMGRGRGPGHDGPPQHDD